MQTETLVSNALTAMQAQPTKEQPPNIVDWAKWLKLETFGDPELERLTLLCAQFAKGLLAQQPPPFWLSIIGKSGTGKTHCAARLWSLSDKLSWVESRYIPRLVYWPAFVESLRVRINEGGHLAELLDMGKWPLLVLDDIGAERDTTGFASEKLNMLLSMRVGRWTVVTSNLDMEAIAQIDRRIASRIVREHGNLFIEMTTRDYGLRKAGA